MIYNSEVLMRILDFLPLIIKINAFFLGIYLWPLCYNKFHYIVLYSSSIAAEKPYNNPIQ